MAKIWTLDYIEDAATSRRTIRRRDGSVACATASNYDPPENGVHLCGVTDDEEQPTTVASYLMSRSEAIRLFTVANLHAECAKGEHDFVVDLCVDGEIGEDFYSNRQLWPRAIEAWNTHKVSPSLAEIERLVM